MTTFVNQLPSPRVRDPRSAPALRWGIMGTGWIAERFVDSLRRHSSQHVAAVGSRNHDGATAFASRFDIRHAHPNYEALVADRDVDIVYVATPHNLHLPCALLAIEAGKHTLIEKPLALNAAQARRISDAANARGLFCMEAHWTSFLPKYDVLRQILDAEMLGDLTAVVADFGEWFPPQHRIFRPELAGGPMLDLGTYLVSFVVDVLGKPDEIVARGTRAPSGVMEQTAMIMKEGSRQAVLHTTISANTPTTATITGTAATLVIDGPFYQPGGFHITPADGGTPLTRAEPRIAHQGLHYQAAEVARQIAAGETGSPLRPMTKTIDVLSVMDEVRLQTGDTYSDEATLTPDGKDPGPRSP